MHRIIINKLGPISHAEFECNQFMILTGCQASGKSTIAKALFYFRTVKDDILSLIVKKASGLNGNSEKNLTPALRDSLRDKFLNVFGSSWGMNNDMRIEYHYTDEIYIKVSLKEDVGYGSPNYVWIELSQGILDVLKLHDQELYRVSNSISDDEKQILKQDLSAVFDDKYETIFIPAGRSMITLLATQLNYIYSTMDDAQKRAIDFCTRSYLENVIKLRPEFENGLSGLVNKYPIKARKIKKALVTAERIIQTILKGAYRYNNGDERLEISGNHYVKINFTSSGQQESVWILNLLFYYMLQSNPTFFIIEEPESHLFPDAQKSIIELISLVYSQEHSALVTTHSPYVLGAFNNLIFANQFDKSVQASAAEIIDPSLWINKKDVIAWFVCEEAIQDAIDTETGMIQNELIDEISGVINDEFDRLLSIQLENEGIGE